MSDKSLRLGNLSPIRIHTPSGSCDISSVVTNIEVLESLFTPFIIGKIVVHDTESMRFLKQTKMSSDLVGRIEFSFAGLEDDGETPQKEIVISKDEYYVYKILQSEVLGFSSQVHEIYFCHRSFFRNETTNVSRSYKKKKVSEIVEDLGERLHLKWNMLEKTEKTFNFVLPNRTIAAQINFLAPYARRKENPEDVNYLFFQDLSGKHNFVSAGKLLGQEPSFGTSVSDGYAYGINRGTDFASARRAAVSHRAYEQCQFKNAINGMHSSAVMSIDPGEKVWSATTFFLPDQWKKGTHLSNKPIVEENSEFYSMVNGAFSQRFYMKARHSHCCKEQKNGNSKIGGPDDWLLKRISQMEQLQQSIIEFTVTGNSDLHRIGVGKVIYFGRPLLNTSVNTSPLDKDLASSGKYIILSTAHIISRTLAGKLEYTTTFKCGKDSYGEEH